MPKNDRKSRGAKERDSILERLQARFEGNMHRH